MKKIVCESFQDVEIYLLSNELLDKLQLSNDSQDSKELSSRVVELVGEEFPDDESPQVESVIVFKVRGNDVDVVDSNHYVVKYNGTYYDYGAMEYSDQFNNMITKDRVPVVQDIITNDLQINDKVSTIKGYAMLQYKEGD